MGECARLSRVRRRAVAIAMPSQAADDDVCLKIVEMIGEERRVRDVRVSRHEEVGSGTNELRDSRGDVQSFGKHRVCWGFMASGDCNLIAVIA